MLTTGETGIILLSPLKQDDAMPRPTMRDWKTTTEVAKLLQVTPQTVVSLVKRGRLPGAYKIDPLARNSPYRIPNRAVDRYIKEQRGKL